MGQTVTEVALVEEAAERGAWPRVTTWASLRKMLTPNSASTFTEKRSAKPSQSVEYIYSYLLTIYFHRIS